MNLTKIKISDLTALDISQGFLEALARLADVHMSSEDAVKVLRSRIRAGIFTYVARDGDRVAGTASLLVEDKFIHGGSKVGHIEDVAVHPNYQSQGVGAALVEHIVEQSKKVGCYKVILNCHDHVVPFYEKMGFRAHDTGMRLDLQ